MSDNPFGTVGIDTAKLERMGIKRKQKMGMRRPLAQALPARDLAANKKEARIAWRGLSVVVCRCSIIKIHKQTWVRSILSASAKATVPSEFLLRSIKYQQTIIGYQIQAILQAPLKWLLVLLPAKLKRERIQICILERQQDKLGRFAEGGSSHASICYIWCMDPSSNDRTDLTFPSMRITGEKLFVLWCL
ncbi:hypothetical protein K1719_040888 [Acacia pycnantha]|nr:hypothetical protein K1719_040888 [Acacia pycnantha]